MYTWKPEEEEVEYSEEDLFFLEQVVDVDEGADKVEGCQEDTEEDMSQGGQTHRAAHVRVFGLCCSRFLLKC